MAHKKAGGSTRLGRDSESKRLGVKIFGGQHATAGNILVRQRGTKWHPGTNVRVGRDDTLYTTITGIVRFQHTARQHFTGIRKKVTVVHVDPIVAEKKAPATKTAAKKA